MLGGETPCNAMPCNAGSIAREKKVMRKEAYRDSDDSLLAHALHGTGYQVPNLLLTVSGNGADLEHIVQSVMLVICHC